MDAKPRHSTRARAKFHLEFGAALRAIEKLPPPPPKQLISMRPNPETEMCRSFPWHAEALKLGYYKPSALTPGSFHGKLRDETTDYNETMFMQRNLFKGMVQ